MRAYAGLAPPIEPCLNCRQAGTETIGKLLHDCGMKTTMNHPAPPPLAPTQAPAAFLDAAAGLLGERGLTTDPDRMDAWLTDWRGRYTGRALALAAPASTAEVAELVKLCAGRQ
jgi:hypothetical protein